MSAIEKNRNRCDAHGVSVRNEKGNVLIFALLILVLVTMIGLSASRTASVDILVAGNNMNYKKNFYKAEASALEAIGRMEDLDLENDPLDWVTPIDIRDEIDDDANWADGAIFPGSSARAEESSFDDTSTDSKYVVIAEGVISTGESLDMTRTKIYQYAVYGRTAEYNGKSIISIGYRKVH